MILKYFIKVMKLFIYFCLFYYFLEHIFLSILQAAMLIFMLLEVDSTYFYLKYIFKYLYLMYLSMKPTNLKYKFIS